MTNLLRADEITARLKTNRLGAAVHVFQEICSTNTQAMQMASKGAEEGTLVIGETQTEGKGRRDRKWFSPPGVNLYFSVVLRPKIDCAQATILPLLAGIAVVHAIRQSSGLTSGLKWPNDVLINGKKVAGILTELAADDRITKYLVLGIGLNVNLEAGTLPVELSEIATSLKIESGRKLNRLDVLETLVNQIERWYTLFLDQGPTPIIREYSQFSKTVGQQIQAVCQDKVVEGKAIGLAPNGGLILQKHDGLSLTILTGDVIHLR